MLEIFKNGGPLMYLILLLSVLGLGVVIERFIYFFLHEKGETDVIKKELEKQLAKKDLNKAVEVCNLCNNSSTIVLREIIKEIMVNNEINILNLEEKAREVALHRMPKLEKNMWLLGVVANVTPLVGLLGTVSGMIIAFTEISTSGTGNPSLLANGISQALITTAAGLTVAIPAVIAHNFFNKKVDVVMNEIEKSSVEIINLLRK